MLQVYLIIGIIVGAIFALGIIFLAVFFKEDLMKIVNKNNMSFASHATILTIAVVANVVFWPIVVAYLGRKLWRLKFSTRP